MRRRGCHWLEVALVALVALVVASGCGGNDGTGTAGPPTPDAGGPQGGDTPAPAEESPSPR